MLPFLEEEDMDELVEKILSGEVKGVKLMMLYPFLSRESLNKVVDHLIKENKGKDLNAALPFISKAKVNEIYEAVQAGTITGIKDHSLMPFLGKSKIKEMFNKLVKEAKDFDDNDDDDEEDDE
jgi:radical SAM superfamily enzyme